MTELISNNILADAYKKQNRFIQGKTIAGYKAAMASFATQQKVGLTSPITGTLYTEGRIENNTSIELNKYINPKIETEIGYILSKKVTEPVNLTNIKDYIAHVLPVFEIPEITTNSTKAVGVPETIAKNGFSSHYVVGTPIKIDNLNINECVVKLLHNSTLVSTGYAKDSMDNQFLTLCTTINMSLEHGHTPKCGDLIITGALGNILSLEKGKYMADYGLLGQLSLNVE